MSDSQLVFHPCFLFAWQLGWPLPRANRFFRDSPRRCFYLQLLHRRKRRQSLQQ